MYVYTHTHTHTHTHICIKFYMKGTGREKEVGRARDEDKEKDVYRYICMYVQICIYPSGHEGAYLEVRRFHTLRIASYIHILQDMTGPLHSRTSLALSHPLYMQMYVAAGHTHAQVGACACSLEIYPRTGRRHKQLQQTRSMNMHITYIHTCLKTCIRIFLQLHTRVCVVCAGRE